MRTLHGLVNKGVKVDLGIPYDLWDEPSAEVTMMKKQCERMLEKHEDVIEDWYFNKQKDTELMSFLCRQAVLKNGDQTCLDEAWTGKETKYDKGDNSLKNDEVEEEKSDVPEKKAKKEKKVKKEKKNKKTKEEL